MQLQLSNINLPKWSLLARFDAPTIARIVSFKAHIDMLYAITLQDQVLACGNNVKCNLGLGHRKLVETYQEIHSLQGKGVIEIVCGRFQCVARCESGDAYIWLHSSRFEKFTPKLMTPLRVLIGCVKQVKCGDYHTVFLLNDGSVLVWGWNNKGQLGIGNTEVHFAFAPLSLEPFSDEPIMSIECGSDYSFAVSEDNKAYAWGDNSKELMGIESKTSLQLTPSRVVFTEEKICAVSCSRIYTYFLCARGRVIVKGKAGDGFDGFNSMPAPTIDRIVVVDYGRYCEENYESLVIASSLEGDSFLWNDKADGNWYNETKLTEPIGDLSMNYSNLQMSPAMLKLPTLESILKEKNTSFCSNIAMTFNTSKEADIKFVFPNQTCPSIVAHRYLLSVSSSYFDEQLSTRWPAGQFEASIKEHSYELYFLYLRWIYTRVIMCTNYETIIALYNLAANHKEDELVALCLHLLRGCIRRDTCCALYVFARGYKLTDFEHEIRAYMARHFFAIVQTEGFAKLCPREWKKFCSKFVNICGPQLASLEPQLKKLKFN